MNGVKMKDSESIESAITRFNRTTSGVLAEMKDYKHYQKPSEIRHKNKKAAIRKRKIQEMLEKQNDNNQFGRRPRQIKKRSNFMNGEQFDQNYEVAD